MKKLLGIALLICVGANAYGKAEKLRLSKKDKQDLMQMMAEPMARSERLFEQINSMVEQVQNFVVQFAGGCSDNEAKECCVAILENLDSVELLCEELADELEFLSEVVGDLDDESFSNDDFMNVNDIDEARLSVISWLKTIYRELIKDQFIS